MAHGALGFPLYQNMGDGIFQCSAVPFWSVNDIQGDLIYRLSVGDVIYAPAQSPYDFTPIAGTALKLVVTELNADYETSTVSFTATAQSAAYFPQDAAVAIISKATNGVGDIPSELVYPDLPAGFSAAVMTIEMQARQATSAPVRVEGTEIAPGGRMEVGGAVVDVYVNGQLFSPTNYTVESDLGKTYLKNTTAYTWNYVIAKVIFA